MKWRFLLPPAPFYGRTSCRILFPPGPRQLLPPFHFSCFSSISIVLLFLPSYVLYYLSILYHFSSFSPLVFLLSALAVLHRHLSSHLSLSWSSTKRLHPPLNFSVPGLFSPPMSFIIYQFCIHFFSPPCFPFFCPCYTTYTYPPVPLYPGLVPRH